MTHSHAVMAKPTVTAAALVSDTFTRANSTTSMGTADSGQSWAVLAGTWGIVSNRGYRVSTANGDATSINAGQADQMALVTLSDIGITANSNFGVIARCTNSTNYYLVQKSSATQIQLFKNVAGSFTQLGSTTTVGTWANGDIFGLRCVGTSIQARYNGSALISVTDSGLSTGNLAGFRSGAATDTLERWDDFTVTAS